jgi:hypothetical protein
MLEMGQTLKGASEFKAFEYSTDKQQDKEDSQPIVEEDN